MAGYQTIEALRPILHRGPPPTPVLDRLLFYKPRYASSPKLHHIHQMIELRKQGHSTQKIAEITGFGRTCVRRVTQHVAPPPGGWGNGSKPSRYSREKASRMRRAGFTVAEVAEDLGCSKSTVHQVVTGYRRKGIRRPASDLCKALRCLRAVSGISSMQIRRRDDHGSKVAFEIAKARHIIFWVASRRLGLNRPAIAERLGGFNVKTVYRGIVACDAIASTLHISDSAQIGTVVRMLWQAEWPKASA